MASDDFDINRLTERQQVSYFAAKSNDSKNPLLSSPFRLDHLLASQSPSSTSKLSSQIDIITPSSPSSHKSSYLPTPYSMSPVKSPKRQIKIINRIPLFKDRHEIQKNIDFQIGKDDISDYISQLEILRSMKQKISQSDTINRLKSRLQ